jgi:hypothetical protein
MNVSGSTFFLYRQKESSKEKPPGCVLLLCTVPALARSLVAAKAQGRI